MKPREMSIRRVLHDLIGLRLCQFVTQHLNVANVLISQVWRKLLADDAEFLYIRGIEI
jgi:ppGpp synthetase/RelA/SpoT-type nucleotidyltranferase